MHPEDLGIGTLFERIRDAAIVADTETQRIVLWNPAATNIFGYSVSEALRLRVEALVPARLKDQHKAGMARYVKTGHGPYIDSQRPLELPALCKGGEQIHVEMSLSAIGPVSDPNGGGHFVLAIIRDIIERKRNEKELKESEERFRLLVEGVKDYAIFMLDPEGRVATWNEGAHRIKGYSQQEILGRHFSIFYTEENTTRGHPEEELRIAAAKGAYEEEGLRVRKDGSRFWASVSITALRDEHGSLRGFAKVTRDVTERKQAEEEIRQLNRILEELKNLVGKLVVSREEEKRQVAYELHEKLAQVAVAAHLHLQAFSGRFSGTESDRSDLEWAMKLIQQTISDARKITTNLRPTELDDFGLVAAISSEVERLREEGYQVNYEQELGDERLSATVEDALFRVVQEALTNVRKHAQTRRVQIKLWRRPDEVHLEVRDYGCGFDPAAAFVGSRPDERAGLIEMRERVTLLGGELKIMSKLGAGTSLVAEVPLPRNHSEVP